MPGFSLRGIDEQVHRALKERAERSGISINALILDCIHKGLGIGGAKRNKYHDLDHLAGTWTDREKEEFLAAVRDFEAVDEGLWK